MPVPRTRRTLPPGWLAAIALCVLTSAAFPRQAFSQTPAISPGPTLTAEWTVEQQARERWLHGLQKSRFTPFHATRQWVIVDSIRSDGAARHLYLTLGRNAYGRDSALIVVGPTGQVTRLDAALAHFVRRSVTSPGDSARYEERRRVPDDGGVALPESRLRDLVPSPPPQAPRTGLTWADTIARVASDGPFRQEMHGTRTSRIVGERIVDGRRLWVVRDSGAVTYEEHYPERERTLDTTVLISRRATGTIRGTHLYDPALPLARQRDDTTSWVGQATLSYPDGRTFHTPARFERTRHWTLLDSPAYAARMAELRSASRRGVGGMVLVPDSRLEKQLAAGDVTARDSLLAVWHRTADPDSAAAIFHLLEMWPGSADSRALIEHARAAAGDTAYLYTRLSERVQRQEPLDTADVRALLPFMQDPALAWSVNLSRDWPYENLARALTLRPPAAGESDFPYRSVACTSAACRLLADQWHSASEPRLRDVGLVALLATDPAHWADTVLALDGPRHPLLHGAARLARGVAATWDAASKAPMPPPNSDWHAWLEWMDGRDPRYVAIKRQSSLPPRFRQDTLPRVRFEQSHITAIRFFQARTGRDIVAELRHGYDAATSDTARLVFGTMLEGLGELQPTAPQVVQWFRSGNSAQAALARRMLHAGFAKSARADTTVTVPLLERLLAAIVDSAPLWPNGVADREARRSDPAILHMPRGVFFLDTLGLPPRIRAEWGSRVKLLPRSAWHERDVRAPGVFYTIAPITTWGHFARVDVTASERFARKPDEAPRAYASGATYWLMNVDGQWVIVDESHWVT